MSSKKTRITASLAAAAMIATVLTGTGCNSKKPNTPSSATTAEETTKQISTWEKYKDLSSEQIISGFQMLPKDEFKQEIKNAFEELSLSDTDLTMTEETIILATALDERFDEYSEDEVVSLIKDAANELTFRYIFLELYCHEAYGSEKRTANGNDMVRKMIFDSSVQPVLKDYMIGSLDFSDEEGYQMLLSVANGEEDLLAFQAIKRINRINNEDGIAISREILKSCDMQMPQKINAALKTMSKFFRETRIKNGFTESLEEEKLNFIEICNNIINNSKTRDVLFDSAVFALSDMTDSQAITAIIENSNIDDAAKSYSVEQNYLTLVSMAKSGDEKELAVVCQAMAMNPLKELREPLATALTQNNTLSDEIKQEVTKAITQIDSSGTNANPAWSEFYNEID